MIEMHGDDETMIVVTVMEAVKAVKAVDMSFLKKTKVRPVSLVSSFT
jgi:hypothetical protein